MASTLPSQQNEAERPGLVEVYTIGFTQSSASDFFGRLQRAGVTRVVDVRLRNTSQLAGFAKGRDLPYFLHAIAGIAYHHEPLLAPTADMLDAYKKGGASWDEYEKRFLGLLSERHVEEKIDVPGLAGSCLLCSEATPHFCHRRVAAEYLAARTATPMAITHL